MATTRRTTVQALDDLTAEIRTMNRLKALELGTTAWEHDDGKRATTPQAQARVGARNQMRADIRQALDIPEEGA